MTTNTPMLKKAFRAAFPHTIPIFAGFWFLGLTYGIYMNVSGFSFWYPMLMSLTIFAGSVEFVTVNMLMGGFNPLQALAITLMINARHLFYDMTMTLSQQIITIAMVILGTALTRFLPFLLFPSGKPTPKYIQYLGKVLPSAVFGLLIIYCLKNVSLLTGSPPSKGAALRFLPFGTLPSILSPCKPGDERVIKGNSQIKYPSGMPPAKEKTHT